MAPSRVAQVGPGQGVERRRVQQDTLGDRARSGDPLYGIRRLLLRGAERHTEGSRARLEAGLAGGDPRDEVLDALLAKEALRLMYAAPDSGEAARRFEDFLAECRTSSVPELHGLARTATRWRAEILAHHTTGASNGPTEAVIIRSPSGRCHRRDRRHLRRPLSPVGHAFSGARR